MKMITKRNSIFYGLCTLLALLPFTIEFSSITAFAGIGLVSAILGMILIGLENRIPDPRSRRILFKVAGVGALGPLFGILHNLPFFHNLWAEVGIPDEPVFFMLAVLICPPLFILSAAGCIGLLVWDHFTNRATRETLP